MTNILIVMFCYGKKIFKKIYKKKCVFFFISDILKSLIYKLVFYKKYFLAWEFELKEY